MYRSNLALIVAGVLAWGCGSSTSNGSQTGGSGPSGNAGNSSTSGSANGGSNGSVGGTATAGQSTGGAGGSSTGGSSASTVGDTPAEACIAYARAVCDRLVDCQGLSLSACDYAIKDCPDVYFSPGSTRTVAGLKACALEYAAQSCAEAVSHKLLPCTTPGTRQVGEGCSFSSQCASLACSAQNDQCGVCVALAKEGEACGDDGLDCDSGLGCVDGKCAPSPADAPAEPGQPCGQRTVCKGGFCNAGTCQLLGESGASCTSSRDCKPGLFCDDAGLVCHPPAAVGQPCVHETATPYLRCADSACRFTTYPSVGTCGAYAQIGEDCRVRFEEDYNIEVDCAPGSHCGAGTKCEANSELGSPCEYDLECKTGLACICPANMPELDCTAHICGKPGFTGDPCAPDGNPCHPAFACEANKCVPRTSRGLFEQACQP